MFLVGTSEQMLNSSQSPHQETHYVHLLVVKQHQVLVLDSATLVLKYWLRKKFRNKTQTIRESLFRKSCGFSWGGVEGWGEKAYNCNWITIKIKKKKKVTEVEEVSCGRNGLRKWVTETKEWGELWACSKERERQRDRETERQHTQCPCLKGSYLRSQGRISIEYSSDFQCAPQGCGLHGLVVTRAGDH